MSDFTNINEIKLIQSLQNRIANLEEALTSIGYDAKASKKRRFATKRQASVLHSLTRAMCVETIDPWKENRIRFYHPLLHDPKTKLMSLQFASPVSAMGGFDDCGLNWVPPAGSTVMLLFEGGSRDAPFYIGTTWHRNRGPNGQELMQVYPSREYQAVYQGHRKGYLVGKDDESQVLPPWNTESSNGSDIDQIEQFYTDPNQQKRITYPNIYGFKTPEKHMLKMVDGDAKCNRRWKRIEMQSGGGNWMIFKDDHIHYGGQWAHTSCGAKGGDVSTCSTNSSNSPYFSDIHGNPIEGSGDCGSPILQGKSSTPGFPPDPPTKYYDSNKGSNPFFKNKNECRPYKGPGTKQNNKCDLPQSGIQFLSIAGNTMVFDDSVEEPRGKPEWERSLQDFDYGCTDKYLGRMYIRSAHGHEIALSDVEEKSKLRGKDNYIRLLSSGGNKIELNDHTVGPEGDQDCPPRYAGEERGVHIQSTSNHVIKMIDHMNVQCSPIRKAGGIPQAKATKAYIQIKSGSGLEMRFSDDSSQEKTDKQWIQITHPQCVNPSTDDNCNSGSSSECRGPHFLRFQGRPKGQPGIVFLRAGGHSIRQTYDMDIVLVGDKEKNPADKFTYVSKKHIRTVEETDFRYSGDMHILFAEKQILLMAGRDCPPKEEGKCWGPCLYPVVLGRCPWVCPLTGAIHWTETAISERVFASGWRNCPPEQGNTHCNKDQQTSQQIDTGSGNQSQVGSQNVSIPGSSQP